MHFRARWVYEYITTLNHPSLPDVSAVGSRVGRPLTHERRTAVRL
jgi:hypothetical protein